MLIKLETIDKDTERVISRWWEDSDPVEAQKRWTKHFNNHPVKVTPVKHCPTKYKIGQRVRAISDKARIALNDEYDMMNPSTCGKVGVIISVHRGDNPKQGAGYLIQFTDDITVDGEQWTWDFEDSLPVGQSQLSGNEIEGLA